MAILWNEVDRLQLHVQETLVWVSVVPFIRPMKPNIQNDLSDRRGRTLTQAFPLSSLNASVSQAVLRGLAFSRRPPTPVPPSGLCAPVFPALFPAVWRDGRTSPHSSPSRLGICGGRGLCAGGGEQTAWRHCQTWPFAECTRQRCWYRLFP